ncbi:MAG: sterol desaturase family protein [Verrucomicrobiales bacterium]|nr:sterol desaturase family protein [Verrucomicrobiales bacterium]
MESLEEYSAWIAIGTLLVLLAWESFQPFFPFFRGKGRERVRHGFRNTLLGIVNGLMTSLGFVIFWKWAVDWSGAHSIGLLHRVSWPAGIELAVAVLLLDFWTYWWHRMNHRIPFLWRFHRVHHADPEMDVTTANRFHFGEIILSSLLRVPVLILIGAQLWQLAFYEVVMFAVVQFHHANIAVPPWLDRVLRLVTVTPAMHKVHHSRLQVDTDSNYTSLFSWWDRIFGSFRLRPEMKEIHFGLDEFDAEENQTLIGMAKTPFRSGPEIKKEEGTSTL